VTFVDDYLARLGLEREPPSVEALFRLHRAHVERVPYETLWIQLGQVWGVSPAESVARIANQRRGGYCFHLNGALCELLLSLGFTVSRHVGGVHGPAGPSADEMSNHLVLSVSGLPTTSTPNGVWYVDAGLGDALHEPLPLVAGVYEQGPFRLGLEETSDGVGDWHLSHDPSGSFTGMSWTTEPATMDAFAERHVSLSTAPESGFVRFLTVQRRDADGVDILRGLTLRRLGRGATHSTLGTKAELFDALTDLFGLDLSLADPAALQAMWDRSHAAHEAWESAGRP
jgi:arylamine N-acetyltransferase